MEKPVATVARFWHYLRSVAALAGGTAMISASVFVLQAHFQAFKDVNEYALPLAAEIPPLEHRASLLTRQNELSTLEASLRTGSAQEKLNVFVLPEGDDLSRLLAFVESARTFLERKKLLQSMSAIDVTDAVNETGTIVKKEDGTPVTLRSRTLRFTATVRPEGRTQLFSILNLSGMLTVGDVLSPENIRTLFRLTESENYAGIVPVERFLSSDLLSYVQDPKLTDERLSQALASEEFLSSFKGLLQSSQLPEVREFLTGDLGRTLVAQKLWPVQFMTVEKESLEEMPEGWEKVEVTVKAYSR